MSEAALTLTKEQDLGLALSSGVVLPPVIARAGTRAAERLIEFFTAHIRNPNTRRAYGRVAWHFFAWIDERNIAHSHFWRHSFEWCTSLPSSACVNRHYRELFMSQDHDQIGALAPGD